MKNKTLPFTESQREELVNAAQTVEASSGFDGFWEQVESEYEKLTTGAPSVVEPKVTGRAKSNT